MMTQRKSGWGAPTGRIAALHSLCTPLTAPANAQITCDQSTCALVCDQGFIGVGKRRTKCRWNASKQFFWKKQLGTCETCEDLTAPAHLVEECSFNFTGKKKCKYTCPAGENMMLPGSATQPKVFAAACKCPRGTNPRVCGWWGRKFSTTTAMAQADLDAITCIEGTATTAAPTTTSAAAASTTGAAGSTTGAAGSTTGAAGSTTGAAGSTTAAPVSTTGASGSTTAAPASTTAVPASSTTGGSTLRADCITQLTADGHNDPTEACDAVIMHNTYRANHNAYPFVIPSAALCAGAQAWADSEAAANENGIGNPSMMHSESDDRPGEGENMAWSSSGALTLSEATTMWQSEDAYWDFTNHQNCAIENGAANCPSCIHGPNPGGFGDCGHFTQNVWKATTSVCVAKAVNSAGTFVVARYEPGGNFMSQFTTQVDGGGPLDGNYVGTVHVPGS